MQGAGPLRKCSVCDSGIGGACCSAGLQGTLCCTVIVPIPDCRKRRDGQVGELQLDPKVHVAQSLSSIRSTN